ncbi:MAG: transketolase C-terminal domain-containing protein [Candidatus Jordarchaeaceae archaeon]
MARLVAMTGNEAVAYAVKQCRPDVIAMYPITPQTQIVEELAQFHADGELDAELIAAESEHSAMAACIGASLTGARVFTASASQGIALMFEMLFVASSFRLPIVMGVSNRALNSPLNIWNDMSDTMGVRDSGWIQIYNQNAQESYHTIIQAFRIAEDNDVLLPVMSCHDGFVVSHATEGLELLNQEDVDDFLPPRETNFSIDVNKPVTVGCVGVPEYYPEIKVQQEIATQNSLKVIKKVFGEFNKRFGTNYEIISPYKMEDAEVALLTIGSLTGTAQEAVNKLRKDGKKIGLLKLRVFRPFPVKELQESLRNVRVVGVIDRNISFGSMGGALGMEVKSALYELKNHPHIMSFPTGLGGRDTRIEHFEKVSEILFKIAKEDKVEEIYKVVGCRGPGCINVTYDGA